MTVIALPPCGADHPRRHAASRARPKPGFGAVRAIEPLDLDTLRRRNELIASVNHELRTPLTSIVGYSEVLLSGDAGSMNEMQHSMVQRVAVNGSRLLELIEELVRTTSECLVTNQTVDLGEVMLHVVSTPRVAVAAPPPGHPDGPATA